MAACSVILLLVHVVSLPNFVILFADDLGYGDIGVFGAPTIRTPNLDAMAAKGMRLTQFYASAPVCTPSRAALLTGRYAARTGVWSNASFPMDGTLRVFFPTSPGGLPADEVTIPKALRASNYTSAIIGKWHLGHAHGSLPHQNGGFDYFYGLPYSQDEGCPPGLGNQCDPQDIYYTGVPLFENDRIIQQPVNLSSLMSRYISKALSFVDQAVARQQPFFLYLAYDEVHIPLFSSPNFVNVSARGAFGDAVEEMDASIGTILAHLSQLGVDKNTFVFFTSDNGPWLEKRERAGSVGPFVGGGIGGGKGSTYEGGMREPAIAYWPGTITEGVVSLSLSCTMDLFVTLLELAKVPLPSDRIIDGVSLVPILMPHKLSPRREDVSVRDFFYYYRGANLYAVRFRSYKAHFITRPGYGLVKPEYHDPPLVYNIDIDWGEQWPLDPTTSEVRNVLAILQTEITRHNATWSPRFPPELNKAFDLSVDPCCDAATFCQCGN